MTKRIRQLAVSLLLVMFCLPAAAENILTVRSAQAFEQSMASLKASIEAHGYEVAHEQRCDSGLAGMGYHTDRYRIVFVGRFDEVRRLSAAYPELIPFLPLKIAVFAEGDQTIISTINPVSLGQFYPDAELQIQFRRWENDLRSILEQQQFGRFEQTLTSSLAE